MSEYIKKYSECEPDIPVDLHTKSNELHYKIWCIVGFSLLKRQTFKLNEMRKQKFIKYIQEAIK